eukprot:4688073-Pleurochrysis_carterae.AAC.2
MYQNLPRFGQLAFTTAAYVDYLDTRSESTTVSLLRSLIPAIAPSAKVDNERPLVQAIVSYPDAPVVPGR